MDAGVHSATPGTDIAPGTYAPASSAQSFVGNELNGNRQSAALECFQSDLLCEHHIAGDEATFGHEAPPHFETTCIIQLMDVHRGPEVDSVSPTGGVPDDIKVALGIQLLELRRRKPGV